MKKFFLLTVILLTAASSASAQFTNSGSSRQSSASSAPAEPLSPWNTVWVEWNPTTFKYDSKNRDNESFTGFSLGYSHALSVSPTLPLFVELGIGAQYTFKKINILDDDDLADEYGLDEDDAEDMDPTIKCSLLSAKVPINLMYAFHIPNSSVSIIPFVGATLRFNIIGKQKFEWNFTEEMEEEIKDQYGTGWKKEEQDGIPLGGADYDLFSKKDMGSSSATWKRFQIGWQIGVKARLGRQFQLGVSYGSDFNEIAKKTKIATTSVNIGYTF